MAPREDPLLAFSTALSVAMVVGVGVLGLLPRIIGPLWDDAIRAPLLEHSAGRLHRAASASGDNWTNVDIVRAREECMHVLKSISADVDFLPPIRTAACGLPAPIRLKSIGAGSKVVFDPPVETNCRMTEALYRWTKHTLQPEANKNFRSSVSRIVGASAYSCRNVYFLPTGSLSQHAFANAIDLSAFELTDGRTVTVLNGWGLTARDAKIAASQQQKSVRSKSVSAKSEKAPETNYRTAASNTRLATVGLSLKTSAAPESQRPAAVGKEPDPGTGKAKPTTATSFLKNLHKGACREFGTALGPEANDAHRNHFHFDLNPSRSRAYCH